MNLRATHSPLDCVPGPGKPTVAAGEMTHMGRLAEKVAVVFGAGNAVGDAVIELFRREGASVEALTPPGADEAAWAETFARIAAARGRIDVVVNAAHRAPRTPIGATAADFMAAFDALAETAWLLQKHAVLSLRKTGGGVIVVVTSVLARVAAPEAAALCAAARGVLMSAKSAALECARAKDNVVVNAVLAGRLDGDPTHWPDGALLLGAPAVTPAEVAEGVAFMATAGAAYMTGVELPVDGGFLAG
jgi:NAD(P)-dependent dehydrogenase (short-subunit alcohol dehydrogenase family)